MRSRTSRLLLILLFALAPVPTSAQAAPQKPEPTTAEIARREALIRKALADEFFIAGRRAEADAEYDRAQQLMDDHFPAATEAATMAAIRYLRADIRFRRAMLADPKADFFTSMVGPSVVSPVASLQRLQSRAADIRALATEITNSLAAVGQDPAEPQIAQARNQLNLQLATLDAGQQGSAVDDYSRRIRDFRSELEALAGTSATNYETIAKQYDILKAKEEEGITVLVQETARIAGLPTELQGMPGNTGNQIKQLIAANAAVALATPEARGAIRDVIVGITSLRDAGSDPARLAELLTQPTAQVRGVFRDRFFTLYSAVGRPLYEKLNQNQQRALHNAVSQRKPLLALADLLYTKPIVESAVTAFLEGEGSGVLNAIEQPTKADLERALKEWLTRQGATTSAAFDGILKEMSEDERGRVRRLLAEQALAAHASSIGKLGEEVGRLVGEASQQARTTPGVPTMLPKPNPNDGGNAFAVGVLGALGQMHPAGLVSAAVLRIGSLMEATYDAIAKINEASAENQRIAVREAYVRELIDQAVRTRTVAEYELAMAEARAAYARASFKRWEEVVSSQLQANDRRRRYVALRLPLLWYHAEMARRDFAVLDRSVGVWTASWQGSGALRRELLGDPSMVRLALDEDIQLYQWLAEDREIESRRDDLERLNVHWQQVATLARDLLQNYGIGPGGGQIGTVVALSDGSGIASYLGPAELKRFRSWQSTQGRNAQGQPVDFVMHVPVTPGSTVGGLTVTPRHGLRAVDVEVGLLDAAGIARAAPNVDVSHSGMGFVPVWDNQRERFRYVEEVMRPISVVTSPLHSRPMATYTNRWQDGVAAMPFDGYELFTTWKVRVMPSAETLAAQDVMIRFVTQYNHHVVAAPQPETGVETFSGDAGNVTVPREQIAPIMENHALDEIVRRWAASAPSGEGTYPKWRHGLPMSTNSAYWQLAVPAPAQTAGRN